MKKAGKKRFLIGLGLIFSFIVWTLLVVFVDVREIGPLKTKVGLGGLNAYVHDITGVNFRLYEITDWLGIIPIVIVLTFAVLGLIQWIKRKSIFKVDLSLIALGIFYVTVFVLYLIFETVVINYRPVLIDGNLEVSYPSSTTMLVTTVIPSSLMQLNTRIKRRTLKRCVNFSFYAFITFMLIGRALSGVHWITDIVGGVILSAGLVLIYSAVCKLK